MPTKTELRELGQQLIERYNRSCSPNNWIVNFDVYLEENGLYYAYIFWRSDGKRQVHRFTPVELESFFENEIPGIKEPTGTSKIH